MARYILNSVEETMELGEKIGRKLNKPVIINLRGEMGAGKTHFTKGLAKGLGIDEDITSPTFSIMNMYYGGRLPLFHIDAYRLNNLDEAIDAGLAEVFEEMAVIVLEWGDFLEPFFDSEIVDIDINDLGDHKRELIVEGWNDDSTGN